MSQVEVIPVDHLVTRLGQLEQHLKQLGLFSNAEGVRNAITLVRFDFQSSRMMVERPLQPAGAAILAMVTVLTGSQCPINVPVYH